MTTPGTHDALPPSLARFVAEAGGGRVLRATPHFAGASRRAWSVDVETGSGVRPLFLLRDKGDRGGSARDAAFLRALADTPVPVPAVIGTSEADGAILLSRAPGRSEFPPPGDEAERERVAAHLMAVTAALHALDPSRLALDFLSDPTGATANADRSAPLAQARAAARALGPGADPFYTFALDWLEANRPPPPPRLALVHSDMGPGNFLYEDGRVTAIVDWEVAHVGDPMEDLAYLCLRTWRFGNDDLPVGAECSVSETRMAGANAVGWEGSMTPVGRGAAPLSSATSVPSVGRW